MIECDRPGMLRLLQLLQCCSVAVLKKPFPTPKNTSIFIYINIEFNFDFCIELFWNCNTATTATNAARRLCSEKFFEKNQESIREPQWKCCNFAVGNGKGSGLSPVRGKGGLPLTGSLLSPCPFTEKGCPKDGKGVVPLFFRFSTVPSPFPASEI